MALIPTQTLVTVTVRGHNLGRATEALRVALIPFADARIIALVEKTNWVTSLVGTTALVAAIEFTPASHE